MGTSVRNTPVMINPALMNAFAQPEQSSNKGTGSKLDYITNMINIMQQAQEAYAPQTPQYMPHPYRAPYESPYEAPEEDVGRSYEPKMDYGNNYYGTIAKKGQLPHTTGSSVIDLIRNKESTGNYRAKNNLNFIGAYQFGAPALETAGLLRKGAGKLGNKALNNPENWTIPGGMDQFLSNPAIQDAAQKKLMASNRRTLEKMGYITKDTPQQKINAMLTAAHIGGPAGVARYLKGKDTKDVYGASVGDYYKMGLRAKV